MMEKSYDERFAAFDENYKRILEAISNAAQKAGRSPDEITLLAATKTVPAEVINHAVQSGLSLIGENRVQELVQKEPFLSPMPHRHFIGHLQTNKVKEVVGRVEMIQSVHSLKLARVISDHCMACGKVMPVLAEVNIGREESKSGFSPEAVTEAVAEIATLPGVRVCGLMAIPPICEEINELRRYFSQMHKLFIDIKGQKIDNSTMDILSMGMSGDFEVAIAEGANLVRIGSSLFGKRPAVKPSSET